MIVTINSKNNIVNCVRGVLMQVLQVQIKPSAEKSVEFNKYNPPKPGAVRRELFHYAWSSQVMLLVADDG